MGAVSSSSSLPISSVLLLFMTFQNVCASASDVISCYRHGNTTNSPSHNVDTFNPAFPTSLKSVCVRAGGCMDDTHLCRRRTEMIKNEQESERISD